MAVSLLGVPDPFVFKGAAMRQLRDWAELHLTFSPILTNMWCVNAELLQINDKTSSASITFDKDVLVCNVTSTV